ncbi:MAG: DNA/RNA non-specific endonuclease [Candidatus Amulumruptor caecigallinarius]|nr:DNA/RNA non-specific endonuclease [Candidatus Amulumruptor caecigallinarius]MCM1395888.1 DNA/RNA non-specific endonuclease [Candidatus Amulumruptor caecigallinarius]MCM1452923.1 DNA/RNA non-specific endonuclease [bacterium]
MKKFLLILAVAIGIAWSARTCLNDGPNFNGQLDSDAMTRVMMPSDIPSQIKEYEGYTLSFNKDTHLPNWVAWELTAEEARGKGKRNGSFSTDPSVDGCATPDDYKHTGFDRGHMAPAGDMKWSQQAMTECFYMTNMCPQVKSLNSGAWNTLEQKCRQRAEADSIVYIVTGPVPGDTPLAHIGRTHVEVPARFFKVVVSPYANPPQGIGFLMPNAYVEGGVQHCAVTIDSVESLTGYDFFAALPDSIETVLESQCNFNRWSRLH